MLTGVCPRSEPGGHGAPRVVDEGVPDSAAGIDDVVVVGEDAVRQIRSGGETARCSRRG